MAFFLTGQQLFRMLQRELPEGVYPDGDPADYYSTAEQDSVADVLATAYSNLERIYANYFPQTADENILDWEVTVFGQTLDSAFSLIQRRAKILAQIQARPRLTVQSMIDVVKAVIGTDKLVDISEWGCETGGWTLDESQLEIETILNSQRMTDVTGSAICGADPASFGKTQDEWNQMLEQAYTYQVNIYTYVMTAAERITVDLQLLKFEPARSQHLIYDGLNPSDMIGGTT